MAQSVEAVAIYDAALAVDWFTNRLIVDASVVNQPREGVTKSVMAGCFFPRQAVK